MPIFTFCCEEHGEIDLMVNIDQNLPTTCPIIESKANEPCGKHLKRIYTVPNIRFIGSGFYVNDNRRKNNEG